MSIEAMNAVWEMDLKPNLRLVALAYADHASADGTGMYPAIDRIAWKSGYSERQAIRLTQCLVDEGVLIADGMGPYGTSKYRLNMGAKARETYVSERAQMSPESGSEGGVTNGPEAPAEMSPESGGQGVTNAPGGVTNEAEKRAEMSPEPSYKPSIEPSHVVKDKNGVTSGKDSQKVIGMSARILSEAGVKGRPLQELACLRPDLVLSVVKQAEEMERQGTLKAGKAAFIVGVLRNRKAAGAETGWSGETEQQQQPLPAAEPMTGDPDDVWEVIKRHIDSQRIYPLVRVTRLARIDTDHGRLIVAVQNEKALALLSSQHNYRNIVGKALDLLAPGYEVIYVLDERAAWQKAAGD